jgi:hypothetical protein
MNRFFSQRMRILAVLAIALFCSPVASADSLVQWNNIKGGDFADGANWVGGVAPGVNDAAVFGWSPIFNTPQPIAINMPGSYGGITSGLDVQSGQYAFSGSYTATSSIVIGDTVQSTGLPGTATLNVTGFLGTMRYLHGTVTLGAVAGSSGTINFEAASGNFEGLTVVGGNGTGALNVLGGSSVYGGNFFDPGRITIGSAGTVTVSGSLLSSAGASIEGPGSLNVLDGGVVKAGNMLSIGHLLIDGAGSSVAVTDSNFSGNVTIQNGGTLSTNYQDSVYATVTGKGSALYSYDQLGGTVIVQDGGYVRDSIGSGGGAVIGSGSRWSNSILNVTRTLTVADGGTVTANPGITSMQIEPGGVVNGNGGILQAATVQNSGTLHGGGPGTITIVGDYTQTDYTQTMPGILDEQIAGPSDGQYDKTVITGTATLDGTLNLSLLAGFLPSVGDSLIIMTFNAETGKFAIVNGLDMGNGEMWELVYNPTDITLVAVGAEPTAEPGTLGLFGMGLVLAVAAGRRRLSGLC